MVQQDISDIKEEELYKFLGPDSTKQEVVALLLDVLNGYYGVSSLFDDIRKG